jgi:hypothetical protein
MNSSAMEQWVVLEVELERIFNFSMTCGQNMKKKIGVGSNRYTLSHVILN